jgi:hypothetical protein
VTVQPVPPAPSKGSSTKRDQIWANIASPVGYILAVSYPVLALSTGARALYQAYQMQVNGADYNPVAVYLSALAALSYLVATLGFAYRRRWTWWLSVGALSFETLMTLIVGTLSFLMPEAIGRTVWRHFGQDYGFFPLFQPLLGLVWLLWPLTMEAYGIRPRKAAQPADAGANTGMQA